MKALQDLVGHVVLANAISQEEFEPALLSAADDSSVTFSWSDGESVFWNLAYVWRVWTGPIEYTANRRTQQAAGQVDLIHMPVPVRDRGSSGGIAVGAVFPVPGT